MACSIWLRTLTLGSELLSCTGQRLLQGVLVLWASRCAEGKRFVDSQDFSEDATREKQCSWGRGWVRRGSAVWAAIAGWRFRKHREIIGWAAKIQHGLLHYRTSRHTFFLTVWSENTFHSMWLKFLNVAMFALWSVLVHVHWQITCTAVDGCIPYRWSIRLKAFMVFFFSYDFSEYLLYKLLRIRFWNLQLYNLIFKIGMVSHAWEEDAGGMVRRMLEAWCHTFLRGGC